MRVRSGHERAADQTQITISLPVALKEKINAFAKAAKRSRSNWIVFELEKIVHSRLAARRAKLDVRALHGLNEEPGVYPKR